MAWISVHESIIGKKLRSLSKAAGCSQNEAIGLLVRLWLWGIKNADRTGLLVDADKDDVSAILTNGLDKSVNAEDVVEAMIQTEWIDDEDGSLYLHDWEEWQKYWYKLIDTTEATKKRVQKHRERMKLENKNAGTDSKKDVTDKKSADTKQKSKAEKYTPEFEELWAVYPYKRGNKAKAARSFNARLKEKWTKEQLIAATLGYADACMKKRTEEQYVMHASRFLGPDLEFEKYLPRNMRRGNGSVAGGMPVQSAGYMPANPAAPNDDDPYAGWR